MKDEGGFEVEQGQEVVDRTIVGGRPRNRRSRRIAIPIGLEKALTRAAGDPEFRRRVFADRQAALAWAGYELTGSEAMIWKVVPDQTLRTMIERIDLKQHAKRRFLKGVATAVFASAALTSAVACVSEDDVATRGVMPDDVTQEVADVEVETGPYLDQGMGADVPWVEDTSADLQPVDVPQVFPDAGVPPDVPGE